MNISRATKSFLTFLRRIERWLKEFIEEFPEFLNSFAEGYQKFDHLDPVSRHERFLKQLVQKDKYVFGKSCVFRVHSLWSLAEFYHLHYRYAEAEKYYLHSAVLLFEAAQNDKQLPFEFRKKIIKLVDFLAHYYKHKEAELMLRRFIPLADSSSSIAERSSDLERLGMICIKTGKHKEAKVCLLNAQAQIEPSLGPDSAKLVELLERQRNAFSEMEDSTALAKCKKHLELITAVSINEKALGEDNPHNASVLRELAAFYASEKKLDFAEMISRRADIAYLASRTKGAPYPGLAHDLRKLAELYRKRAGLADETLAFHADRKADSLQKPKQRT